MTELITLNVGGKLFVTTEHTLLSQDSLLKRMFTSELQPSIIDDNGKYFLDRSPQYFSYIINYLRSGYIEMPNSIEDLNYLRIEADFFGVTNLIEYLEMWKYCSECNTVTKLGSECIYHTGKYIDKVQTLKTLTLIPGKEDRACALDSRHESLCSCHNIETTDILRTYWTCCEDKRELSKGCNVKIHI